MRLKLLSAAVVAPLAMFMMLAAGAAQAQETGGTCSFSDRTSVFGGDCRASRDVRGGNHNFTNLSFDRPSKKVVGEEDEEPSWDRDYDRDSKPGNGYGDKNHDHSGAPGQSRNKGKKNGQGGKKDKKGKPGNGYGDRNHDHTGAPGQSRNRGNNNGQGGKKDKR